MSPHTHEPAHDVSSPVGGFDRFQAIIDADDRPVCAFDPDLRYTAFNRAHAAVMRDLYGADIAIGGCLKDYLTVDADREAISAHLERAFAGERVVTGATSGDPGGLRFFDIVHTPLTDADGTVSGVVVRAREIVTPQDSPALHATFFETALEGFAYCRMLYDDHGRPDDFVCLAVNPAFERVTGLKGVVGKRITAVLPTVRDEMPDIFATHARVSETGEPAEFEIDFKPLGVWLLVSVTRPEPGHFAARFVEPLPHAGGSAFDLLRFIPHDDAVIDQREDGRLQG